ncbi:MAG: hypothetical protein ISS57_11340 [Anaerolineales bacterium]|nr:hypothetical protein [Anaerolineales bacterium]
MKTKLSNIIIAIIVLALASLACQTILGGISDESSPEVDAEAAPEQAEPSGEDAPEKVTDVPLGEEYRSEEGGYSFSTIPGYSVEEFFGLASMEAPDADPDYGPAILLIGGLNEEEKTLDQLFDEFSQETAADENAQLQYTNKRTITIGGVDGFIADLEGTVDGQPVAGRIAVALPSPTQQFTMFGYTPGDQWEDFSPYFDAVLHQ